MDRHVQFSGGPWDNRTEVLNIDPPRRFRVAVALPIEEAACSVVGLEPDYEIHDYDLRVFAIQCGEDHAEWAVYRHAGVDRRESW